MINLVSGIGWNEMQSAQRHIQQLQKAYSICMNIKSSVIINLSLTLFYYKGYLQNVQFVK